MWQITLKTLVRRKGSSLLLLAVVLVGCFAAIVLNLLTQRQEEALADMIANTRIGCTVTDPQGMNADRLGMPGSMLRKLVGTYPEPEENLDGLITDVNAMTSVPLEMPKDHSICSILTLASDPGLAALEGAKVTLYDGWDESVFATDARVCLIPEDEVEMWPEGVVKVMRGDGLLLEMTVIGTVANGPGSVYHTPLNMSWRDEGVSYIYIESCSFTVRDNTRLDEIKEKLYEVFAKPSLSNDLTQGYGLVVHDESYLASLDEIRSNISMLRLLLPVLMVLVGCIGFFASYMTTRSRQKEFAVMRCLGMNQFKIFALVFGEQLLLALVGGGLGITIGWVLDRKMETAALSRAGLVMALFLVGTAIATIRVTGVNVMKLMKVED